MAVISKPIVNTQDNHVSFWLVPSKVVVDLASFTLALAKSSLLDLLQVLVAILQQLIPEGYCRLLWS